MMQHFSIKDLRVISDGPRLHDLKLADALGFSTSRNIRKLIKRNEDELARYGQVWATVAQTPVADEEVCSTVEQTPSADDGGFLRGTENPPSVDSRGGRPGVEYWLNEPQAILIAMLSRTDRAADVRFEIVQVYLDYRRRKTAPGALPAGVETSPLEDQTLGLKLDLVREYRRIKGALGAARMWTYLGMPEPAVALGAPGTESRDWRLCLQHFMTAMAAAAEGKRWGALVEAALNAGDFYDEIDLGVNGLRLTVDADGLIFANGHDGLSKIFEGTPWAEGRWSRALKDAPGACSVGAQRFGGVTCRGVFVPSDVLVDAAIAADPR